MFVFLDLMSLVHPYANRISTLDGTVINDWVEYFGNPVNFLPETPLGNPMDFKSVLLSDLKKDGKYWRHHLFPQYKGNRKPQSSVIANLASGIKRRWVEIGLTLCQQAEFEADDWASYFCYRYPECPKYLMSVDGDWAGLVTDKTYWIDTYANRGSTYRHNILDQAKMLDRFNNHRDIKGKFTLSAPSDIYRIKWESSDKSDNILVPKSVPFRLIDLINPLIRPEPIELDWNSLGRTGLVLDKMSYEFGIPNIEWREL